MKFSALAALVVVILTTSGAACDEDFIIKMMTFPSTLMDHNWAETSTNSSNKFSVYICDLPNIGNLIVETRVPLYLHSLTLLSVWKSYYIHYKMWDEITPPIPNFNGVIVKVREWISCFITHFT